MNTIPSTGVEVRLWNVGEYRWCCGRCKRQGRPQAYAAAEAGAARHRGMHSAQDKAARVGAAFSGDHAR